MDAHGREPPSDSRGCLARGVGLGIQLLSVLAFSGPPLAGECLGFGGCRSVGPSVFSLTFLLPRISFAYCRALLFLSSLVRSFLPLTPAASGDQGVEPDRVQVGAEREPAVLRGGGEGVALRRRRGPLREQPGTRGAGTEGFHEQRRRRRGGEDVREARVVAGESLDEADDRGVLRRADGHAQGDDVAEVHRGEDSRSRVLR